MHICIQSGLCSGERFRNQSNGPSFSPQSFFRAQLWNSCDRVTGLESASPSALLRESAIMEGLVEVGETDWPRWASTLVQQRQCVHTENTAVAWHVGGGRPCRVWFPLSLSPDFDAYLWCHSFTSAWVLWSHFWEKNKLLCMRRSTQDNSTVLKRGSLGPLLTGSQWTFQYRCCNYGLQSIKLCVLRHLGVFANKYTTPSDLLGWGGQK